MNNVRLAAEEISEKYYNNIVDENGNVIRKFDVIDYMDILMKYGIYSKEAKEDLEKTLISFFSKSLIATNKNKKVTVAVRNVGNYLQTKTVNAHKTDRARLLETKFSYKTNHGIVEVKPEEMMEIISYLDEVGYPTNNFIVCLHAIRRYANNQLFRVQSMTK